MMEEHIEYFFR